MWESEIINVHFGDFISRTVDENNNIYATYYLGRVMKYNCISRGKYEEPITIIEYGRHLKCITVTKTGRIFCTTDYEYTTKSSDVIEIFENGKFEIYYQYRGNIENIHQCQGNINDMYYYRNSLYIIVENALGMRFSNNNSIYRIDDLSKSLEFILKMDDWLDIYINDDGDIYGYCDYTKKICKYGDLTKPNLEDELIYESDEEYDILLYKNDEIYIYTNGKINLLKIKDEIETIFETNVENVSDLMIDNYGDIIFAMNGLLAIVYRPSSGPKSAVC